MTIDDNYRLLFGVHAVAMQQAYPDAPPLLERETRHRVLAVLDARAESGADPAEPELPTTAEAFNGAYAADFAQVRPVFRRLAAKPLPRGAYVRLTRHLLKEPKVARALTHFPSLRSDKLSTALALPPELVRPAFLKLVPGQAAARELAEVYAAMERESRPRQPLTEALLRCRKREQVRDRLRRAFTPKQLCPPPWEGDDRLRPVRSTADVRRLGERFKNCMGSYADHWARDGDTVVYVYQSESPAVCAVEVDGAFGWRVEEIQGMANTTPSKSTLADIETRFIAAGIRTGRPLKHIISYWG